MCFKSLQCPTNKLEQWFMSEQQLITLPLWFSAAGCSRGGSGGGDASAVAGLSSGSADSTTGSEEKSE